MKTKVMGLLIFMFVVVGAILLGSGWQSFINLPGLAFVVIMTVGLTMMKYRKCDGGPGIIKSVKRYAIISGVIGCLVGLVQMGSGMSDSTHFHAGLAVAVLTIFYGLVFYCIVDTFAKPEAVS